MYKASDVIGTDSQHPGLVPVIGSIPGTNGNTYASTPVDPAYVERPSDDDYNKGVPPLETLPAQWWNWLNGEYTKRINNMSKQNGVLDNLFKELNNVLLDKSITPSSNASNQLVTALNTPNYLVIRDATAGETYTLNSVKNLELIRIFTARINLVLPIENIANGTTINILYDRNDFSEMTVNLGGTTINIPNMGCVTLCFINGSWIVISTNDKYTIDKIYPIGSIYMNADNNTNPRYLFGVGSWYQITDRYISSYGSIFTSQTGGSINVTLREENIPAHKHPASFTGTRLNVNDAFWAVTQFKVGVNPGEGQATIVDNKLPFKNANFHNYTNRAVSTYDHTGTDVDCLSGSIAFDYTPEGTVTTENTGNGESFSVIPPYYAVYTWKRRT